jgi:RimJ/RimL family protein N-acetyltransferase
MTDISQAVESIRRKLEYYKGSEIFQLAVECKANGCFLGTSSLFHLNLESKRAEVGYVLARPYWGQGYMTEAAAALVDTAFGKLGFNRLEADIDPRNTASAKLLERLGFQREGLLRERELAQGQMTDTALYGLLKSDWDRKRSS